MDVEELIVGHGEPFKFGDFPMPKCMAKKATAARRSGSYFGFVRVSVDNAFSRRISCPRAVAPQQQESVKKKQTSGIRVESFAIKSSTTSR